MTLAHLPKPMYILSYLTKENKVYLMDKLYNVHTYELLVSVLAYQTSIVRKDFEAADKALESIPEDHHNRIARFLEAQDLKEKALQVSKDPEHRFELAMQLKELRLARDILLNTEFDSKWKQLGDAALADDQFDLALAEECFTRAKDLGGLLLLHTSLGNRDGIERLAAMAKESGHNNVAFVCLFLLNKVEECIGLLCETNRIPEAAFLTRSYLPSHISRVLSLWKDDLRQVSPTAADSLADPTEFPEMFPDVAVGVKVEEEFMAQNKPIPATSYGAVKDRIFADLLTEMKETGRLNSLTAALEASVGATQPEAAEEAQPEPAVEAEEPQGDLDDLDSQVAELSIVATNAAVITV